METPSEQHQWLQKLVGTWQVQVCMHSAPSDAPPPGFGREVVRSLGGFFTIGEGEMPAAEGPPHTSLMTLGYDPVAETFRGTFIASMMTHLWSYTSGTLDEGADRLDLYCQGPSMAGDGSMANYRDSIQFLSADHRVMTSATRGENGEWNEFMTAEYKRTAAN